MGATAEEARKKLVNHFAKKGIAGDIGLVASSTIAEACASWLESTRRRAAMGSITYSTFASYESTARLTLIPRCGAIALEALTVGRCNRIIQSIATEVSLATARRARSVLGLVLGYAVLDDAIPMNPMRYIQRLPRPSKKKTILIPEQVQGIRALMRQWRGIHASGPTPNYQTLLDSMDIMLGTSARIGECLAIRREDVDLTTEPPTVLISGTIVQTREQGTFRKNSPKRARQVRRVALPPSAAQAIRRRVAVAESKGRELLFSTRTGAPLDVNNYERLHRSFVDGNRRALEELGVDVAEYSTHVYRRTVATWVERSAGIGLASRLLGHANEQITRANYVVTDEEVSPRTALILEGYLQK
ncbi:tyrosine-type recombinase/integrase [Leucobacter aridicollis]|uniref:tyrosine-type recombinase/integrase n=1 Tax=Leucobacter aridicollis TaxID=283878 RepID=UPI002168CF7D|nr:tyrosine-type recombinase/integrase [Leucobacter aridicollis]MCS3427118.1 integrase [Leucobacter aridicollis]